jgi:hypothetical protein
MLCIQYVICKSVSHVVVLYLLMEMQPTVIITHSHLIKSVSPEVVNLSLFYLGAHRDLLSSVIDTAPLLWSERVSSLHSTHELIPGCEDRRRLWKLG